MDFLSQLHSDLQIGFSAAFSTNNLFWCLVGVTLGTFVGVLPGIGSLAAISMLLPLTYHLDATAAIIMLGGVFYGSSYGGSTASILLNLPGTPSSAIVCVDGYPMSKQGRAGVALLMTTIASFFGATVGIIIMMMFSPVIVRFALHFSPAEYFAMMVMGLVAASSVGTGAPAKGIAMVVLGVALGLVGADLGTGTPRLMFGLLELYEGIPLVVIAMGLFGMAEVIVSIRVIRAGHFDPNSISFRSMIPTKDEIRRSVMPMVRGAGTGSFFGALPGTGGVVASFMAYALEKKISREPHRFGDGAIEGVVAPESANNAADQTAFIPTLTLGIPGNVIMALIIGALIIHGLVPGPRLVVDHPDLFWGLIVSFWIGNVMLLVLNIPFIGLWVRMLAIPYHLMYPTILMFVCIGVYSVRNSAFDILLVAVFGFVGYIMRILGFQPAPLLLGLVLGPLIEDNLRRALLISGGDFGVFVERPISAIFIAASLGLLLWAWWGSVQARRSRSMLDAP